MSSYSSMTDNPLVEAVAKDLRPFFSAADLAYDEHIAAATAALRAIEDAGWKVVKKGEG